jgi:hypothetical protein
MICIQQHPQFIARFVIELEQPVDNIHGNRSTVRGRNNANQISSRRSKILVRQTRLVRRHD